jgi:hypothetical protein
MYEKPTNALVIIHDLYYLVLFIYFYWFFTHDKVCLNARYGAHKNTNKHFGFFEHECRSTLYSNRYGDVNNTPPYNVSKAPFFVTYNSYTSFFFCIIKRIYIL